MKIIFFSYLILSTLSVIGFGCFLNNFLKLKNESSNLGLIGIFGLFLLSLISSFTHLFLSHSYAHNIIVLLVTSKYKNSISKINIKTIYFNKNTLSKFKPINDSFIVIFAILIYKLKSLLY